MIGKVTGESDRKIRQGPVPHGSGWHASAGLAFGGAGPANLLIHKGLRGFGNQKWFDENALLWHYPPTYVIVCDAE